MNDFTDEFEGFILAHFESISLIKFDRFKTHLVFNDVNLEAGFLHLLEQCSL